MMSRWLVLAATALVVAAPVAAVFTLRFIVYPQEACGIQEPSAWAAASLNAGHWMQRALKPDGSYVYIYRSESDSQPIEYNEVRHAGVTMALYQMAGRTGDAAVLTNADRGLAWMTERLHRQDGWAALTGLGGVHAPLGATALMLVGLAERRLSTGDDQYDELMAELGAFLVAMQREDGGFHVAWTVPQGWPDTTGTSRYYPGEALWGLALLHEAMPEGRWESAARDAARFISTQRDEIENVRVSPLNDHWASYGFAEMAEWGLEEPEVAYARRLADRFSDIVERESVREHGGLGGLLQPGDKRRAASLGTWVEGLAALWRLSVTDDRLSDLTSEIEESLSCAAGILASRQVTDEQSSDFGSPELAAGAWFAKGETRMDDQQHALSGLRYASDMADGRSDREPGLSLAAETRTQGSSD